MSEYPEPDERPPADEREGPPTIVIEEETVEQTRYRATCPYCGEQVTGWDPELLKRQATHHCGQARFAQYKKQFEDEHGFPFEFLIYEYLYQAFEGTARLRDGTADDILAIYLKEHGREAFDELRTLYDEGALATIHQVVEAEFREAHDE